MISFGSHRLIYQLRQRVLSEQLHADNEIQSFQEHSSFKKSIIHEIHITITVSGQLPRRTIPHRTGFGPDEWIYSVVVVLVGSWWGIVLGIVVLVGNGWALFLSGGELSSWGVVLEPFITLHVLSSLAVKLHDGAQFPFLQWWTYFLFWRDVQRPSHFAKSLIYCEKHGVGGSTNYVFQCWAMHSVLV